VDAVIAALERLARFLVEPAARPKSTAPLPSACRAAVLGGATDAPPLAAALALTLRSADRRPAALVALWGAPVPPTGPAVRAAKALATAVSPPTTAAGLTGSLLAGAAAAHTEDPVAAGSSRSAGAGAIARGRLVWLTLPPDPVAAVDAVVAAAGLVDGPFVTALAGARPSALDDLVAGHDLVVVAAAPGSLLARTAIERLARRGVIATACPPLGRGVVRSLATAGLIAPRLGLDGEEAR
jgi:hypothetical protein